MRRRVLIALVLGVTILGVAWAVVVRLPGVTGELRIVQQPWSGWTREQPQPVSWAEGVLPGKTVVLRDLSGEVPLRVIDAHASAVTLLTPSGVTLDSTIHGTGACLPSLVTVQRGASVTFETCTLDGGVRWTVTYA